MNTHTRPQRATTSKVQLFVLGLLCMASAFALGSRTSGSVQTIAPTNALGGRLPGDVNADEVVNVLDAILILEIANGYKDATPKELLGDPNVDGRLTVDDALRILRDVSPGTLN